VIVISTPNLGAEAVLPIHLPSSTPETVRTVEGLEVDDDRFRVLSRRIEGMGVLHVGQTYDEISESLGVLIASLAVVVPVVAGLIAGLVWWLVGRTLHPVEAIRSDVAEIGSSDLHRRVLVPETGDEISRLAETMNGMLARVESSVSQQQRFVADASHELRNPLTRIRAALEVDAAAGGASDGQLLEDLLNEVIGLQHMVEDMLYMARSDAGHTRLNLKPVDLDDLVMREAMTVRSKQRVEIDLTGVSAAQVLADAPKISRAIRNLLANGERHASNKVGVSLVEVLGEAVLTIADDGPGIPEAQAEVIFERFTRLDEARSADAGGTGLGLAIAREVANSHGGSLRLITGAGSGATFEMRIPLVD
jgi:signal transduction histidine kinase